MLMAKELQSIQRIKNGCSRSDVGFLCKLCYYLEVDMRKLLEYKKQYHKNEYVTEFGTEYVWIKRFGALFIVPIMERLHIILRKFQNNGNFTLYYIPNNGNEKWQCIITENRDDYRGTISLFHFWALLYNSIVVTERIWMLEECMRA